MRLVIEIVLGVATVILAVATFNLERENSRLQSERFDYRPSIVNGSLILENVGDQSQTFQVVRVTPIFSEDVDVPGVGGMNIPVQPLELSAQSARVRSDGVSYFAQLRKIICEQPEFEEKCKNENAPYQVQIEVIRGKLSDSELLVL